MDEKQLIYGIGDTFVSVSMCLASISASLTRTDWLIVLTPRS